MKGYLIFFQCREGEVKTKGRTFRLEEGNYVYVGSCGRYCQSRVARHLSEEKGRKHWHVDFLQGLCEAKGALVLDLEEKEIASALSVFPSVKGFGSSDDRENESHLFKVEPWEALRYIIGEGKR